MIRICGAVPIRLVTADACRRRAHEHIVDVTSRTGQGGVRPSQGISGVLQVIELGVEPSVHRMAALTRR